MGLAVVGIAGGGIQIAEGVMEIEHGHVASGVKNTAVGSGYAASGIVELTASAKVASKVAAPLAGAAAMVEGGFDIYEGVKHHKTEKIVTGGVKTVGGALLAGGVVAGGSVVGPPVAAVMAIAGTTMIAGAAVYENWDTLKKLPGKAVAGAKAAASWAGDKAGRAWDGAKSVASSAWPGTKDLLGGWQAASSALPARRGATGPNRRQPG